MQNADQKRQKEEDDADLVQISFRLERHMRAKLKKVADSLDKTVQEILQEGVSNMWDTFEQVRKEGQPDV